MTLLITFYLGVHYVILKDKAGMNWSYDKYINVIIY